MTEEITHQLTAIEQTYADALTAVTRDAEQVDQIFRKYVEAP